MSDLADQNLTDRTTAGMQRALASGERIGWRKSLMFMGPAVIASIAYIDPGNFATNIQAGSKYGYSLLWVVLAANMMAMLFQGLSAKLGIVTGSNLAELCRDRFPKPLVWTMWGVSEIAAMATDLAEFLGGAIGLSLLFHIPLMAGMAITAAVTYGILMLDKKGFRPIELIIGGFVAIIALCYLVEVLVSPVQWAEVGAGLITPRIPDSDALIIAVGIIGATVMPHAVYLHSGLTQHRVQTDSDDERRILLRFSNREVVMALSLAGLINMAMVIMAASAFHEGHADVAEIETAYHTLTPVLGGAAAAFFLTSLIASGISSSVVGTMAGQLIMQGFVGFRIPIWLRRAVTMLPAFVVVAMGVDATQALVNSQVVLSIALPFPLVALVLFTRSSAVMGSFANSRRVHMLAIAATTVIVALNVVLLLDVLGVMLI